MISPRYCSIPTLAFGLGLLAGPVASAQDQPIPLEMVVHDHRFSPAEIHIPAGKPALLVIRNADATPEEVESGPLGIEKVIPGGGQSKVRLRPLDSGRYPFFGEYHPETAQGAVVAE
ncbi:MAG: cupredoxin domain-containing protein [Magnetospirillum sp.]|nr:cupredoxin domain-containing protein [Magnetospirillum sp.]